MTSRDMRTHTLFMQSEDGDISHGISSALPWDVLDVSSGHRPVTGSECRGFDPDRCPCHVAGVGPNRPRGRPRSQAAGWATKAAPRPQQPSPAPPKGEVTWAQPQSTNRTPHVRRPSSAAEWNPQNRPERWGSMAGAQTFGGHPGVSWKRGRGWGGLAQGPGI